MHSANGSTVTVLNHFNKMRKGLYLRLLSLQSKHINGGGWLVVAKDLKKTSIFPEGLCERVRLRAGVNFRPVDFGKVEPEFSGVGPSVDLF